jgi:hypothetical protein
LQRKVLNKSLNKSLNKYHTHLTLLIHLLRTCRTSPPHLSTTAF